MKLSPKPGQATASQPGSGARGRQWGNQGTQQELFHRQDPPHNPLSLRKQRKTEHGFSPACLTTGCGSCDKRGAGAGSTQQHRVPPPTQAWLSLQPRWWPANPATVRQNPEDLSGSHRVLGEGDGHATRTPMSLYLERTGTQIRAKPTGAGVQPLRALDL